MKKYYPNGNYYLLRDFKELLENSLKRKVELTAPVQRSIAERLVPSCETPVGRAALAELLASHNTLGTALPRKFKDQAKTRWQCESIFEAIRENAIDWLVDEANYWRELQMEEVAMENLNPLLTEGLE